MTVRIKQEDFDKVAEVIKTTGDFGTVIVSADLNEIDFTFTDRSGMLVTITVFDAQYATKPKITKSEYL